MTIDELLAEARWHAKMSTNDTGTIAVRSTYAEIAQACAQTAQVMMMRDMLCDAEAECKRLRALVVAAYNTGRPITDAALRMVLNVEADSDMTAGQR